MCTIELKLYGDLREKIIQSNYGIGIPCIIDIKIEGISVVSIKQIWNCQGRN